MLEPTAERTFVTTQAAERVITVALPPDVGARWRGTSSASVATRLTGTTRDPLLEWLAGSRRRGGGAGPGAIFAELPRRPLAHARHDDRLDGQRRGERGPHREATSSGRSRRAAEHLPAGAVAIVRDGPEGCAVHADGETTDLDGYPQTAVDTNGAGDTHTGVLVACRAAGRPGSRRRRANAGGAIKVTRRGPATAPTAAEIDDFLAANA